jgi:hypothetical protein
MWNMNAARPEHPLTFYRCHMFYGKRLCDFPDGLPKWSGLSGQSDLIEDSPPEAIKKRKREVEEEEKEKEKEEKDGKSEKKSGKK